MEYFKSTKFKLLVAGFLYRFLKILNFSDIQKVKRNGVFFELDLREGIELSIFLFGSFQKHVWGNIDLSDNENNITIIDVGANIGSISLYFSKKYPNATVYSIEPTNYAFAKLKKNLKKNPLLEKKIIPIQAFVSATDGLSDRKEAFSSWRIDNEKLQEHPFHGGGNMSATDKQISLDTLIVDRQISNVKIIKIDVDGYELDVLMGAIKLITNQKPIIIFEFMGHTGKNKIEEFNKYFTFFENLNYKLYDSKSKKILNPSFIQSVVPDHGGIDILALNKDVDLQNI